MKAVQFAEYGSAAGVLRIVEVPEPHAGTGQVRVVVRASGVTPADTYLRQGRFREVIALPLPHITGVDAAGVIDEVGPGVSGVEVGDAVFGTVDITRSGGANSQYAVLAVWATKPDSFTWQEAGGASANIETATRVLDKLGVGAGTTLLIEGAAGGVGSIAVQLATARGAAVIGTASAGTHSFLAELGATATEYGPGLADRVAELAPGGVTAVLDCAGSGSLPDLVAIAGSASRVVSVADLGADRYGVHLSRSAGPGADAPAVHGLADAAALAEQGRFHVPVAAAFALRHAAAAHEFSETGHAHGKIVLTHR